MDNEIKMMFHTILEEMEERINRKMDARFDAIEARLEVMQHEINACRLEGESISLLIKKIDQLEKEN